MLANLRQSVHVPCLGMLLPPGAPRRCVTLGVQLEAPLPVRIVRRVAGTELRAGLVNREVVSGPTKSLAIFQKDIRSSADAHECEKGKLSNALVAPDRD